MTTALRALCLAVLAAACAPLTTPYAPLADGRGHFEARIAPDRWRVGFRGGPDADAQTVELFLLHRAAEVTLDAGGDHFRIADRSLRPEVLYDSVTVAEPTLPINRRRADVFATTRLRPIQRFEASAEIVVGRGPAPGTLDAYDARAVLETLGPRIDAARP